MSGGLVQVQIHLPPGQSGHDTGSRQTKSFVNTKGALRESTSHAVNHLKGLIDYLYGEALTDLSGTTCQFHHLTSDCPTTTSEERMMSAARFSENVFTTNYLANFLVGM